MTLLWRIVAPAAARIRGIAHAAVSKRCSRFACTFAAGFLLVPTLLAAQVERVEGYNEIFAQSELERYLRLLQIGGSAEAYPWSIRAFSPREIAQIAPRDSAHPWAARYALAPEGGAGPMWNWLRPRSQVIVNSAFPYGDNDGALWAGRGVTAALELGFSARWGPLSLTVAPIAFAAQNAEFELVPNGLQGPAAFGDGFRPHDIDLPQRFGDEPFIRIDPGQSTLRLDMAGVAIGASTANQQWGPSGEHPLLLGTNAPGFPHLFVGTSVPVNIGIGRLHGRVVWGDLAQSDYSITEGHGSRRFMSGIVGVFTPRPLPGLEVGGGRFFHTTWPQGGVTGAHFRKPIEAFWKGRIPDLGQGPDPRSDYDNQLASAFVRWVFPRSGLDVYAEFGREDHSWDLRDFVLEPDHSAGYALGFHKLWKRSTDEWVVMRGELLNTQLSPILRVRGQAPFYTHFATRQGHTQRGQILGSVAAYGGAGSLLATDFYHERGRWSLSWSRTLRRQRGDYLNTGEVETRDHDVMHAVGIDAVFFRGRIDLTAGLRGVYNLNRDFASDRFNINGSLGVRVGL